MVSRIERVRELVSSTALRRAESHDAPMPAAARWSREQLSGRLTEITGVGAIAHLTTAIGLVLEAQMSSEPVVWITLAETCFYPPDVADSGVDLDALVVVRVPSAHDAARAAERLVRSGAFGLLIMDLGKDAEIPTGLQGRLVSLAKRHDTAVVCLTGKSGDSPSLGSMVSLRAEALRDRGEEGSFRCRVKVLKDKQRGPNWDHSEVVRGPAGLR